MPEWLLPVGSLAGSFAVLVFTYLRAKQLGLTDLQTAVGVQTGKLIEAQGRRIALLEQENQRLRTRIAGLESEALRNVHRIDELETTLADMVVAKRPRRAQA